MRISINTETEKIEELKHTISLIENAIKRRENSGIHGEEKTVVVVAEEYKKEIKQEKIQELKEPLQQEKPEIERPILEAPKIEELTPQVELNITKPVSYSQAQQTQQEQKPKPMSSKTEERGTARDIDISSLSMSSYGEAKEGRKMNNSGGPSDQFSSSSMPQPRGFEPRGIEPRGLEPRGIEPSVNNSKSVVKDIISSMRNQRPGQPIQVTDVIGRARGKNIPEQEARNLISQLQREGSI